MGAVTFIRDGLQSIVANLATARDKAATVSFAEPTLDDDQIINAYRGSWLSRNIVDIPADDSCREWRDWKAEKAQIEAIEAEEQRLDVKGKVREARKLARLWGGAAIYVSVKGQDPSQPLEPATVKKVGIDQLTVMTRHDVVPTEIETNPLSEWYGRPKGYTLANVAASFGNTVIHPSRLVIFAGNAIPPRGTSAALTHFWGDSVLLAVIDAVKHAEGTAANIASLIFEAKIDVISVEGLMQRANDKVFIETIRERFSLAATAKGNNGTLILDKGEDYQQKSMNFATLPDILNTFLQVVSGASRIPATVLIGKAPQGMNATGEGDYRNYLDRIKTEQDLDMSPAMKRLDESLIWSALGNRPASIWYDWSPIWTEPPKDKADIFKAKVDAVRALAGGTGQQPIIAIDALSEATVNMLEEDGTLVGIAAAVKAFGTLAEQEPSAEEQAAALPAANPAIQPTKDEAAWVGEPRLENGRWTNGAGGLVGAVEGALAGEAAKEAATLEKALSLKAGEEMAEEEAQALYNAREVPEGWYVHGRSTQGAGSEDPLDTGYVVQMTRDLDTADQYAKEDGSVWYISASKSAKQLDLSDEDGSDMETVKKAFSRGFENGTLPSSMDEMVANSGPETDDADEAWGRIKSSFSPSDIVNSAEAYDDPSIVSWVYEETGADFIHVRDGALALNIQEIKRNSPAHRDAAPSSPIVFAKVPGRKKRRAK